MQIAFLDTQLMGPDIDLSVFESLGTVDFHTATTPEETIQRIKNAEIIITNKVKLTAENLSEAPNLKLIALTCTGTDGVDLEYCRENHIAVTNVAGYSTASVAEQTFTLLFGVMRQTQWFDHFVKNDYPDHHTITTFERNYHEIAGKTWGIIGLGGIGNKVAQIATAFDCNVVYHSTSGKNTNGPYSHKSLEELCKESDIISIHAPLSKRTKNLINKENLKLMKPSAYLLNLGRGGIVNESDLAEALNQNQIAGAGLDVFATEPINSDNPLLSLDNSGKLITSPHIAWASIEARQRLTQEVIENIKAFSNGETRNRIV